LAAAEIVVMGGGTYKEMKKLTKSKLKWIAAHTELNCSPG